MKGSKLILLGIALILFGVSALLLAGLDLPTHRNWIFETLGLVCPLFGLVTAFWGSLVKEDAEGEEAGEQDAENGADKNPEK